MTASDNNSSFAEVMSSEHEELASAVQEIGKELEAANCQRSHVNDKLLRLSELVEAHFRHEEQGGYMAEALERAPQLRPRAEVLQKQHEELQEQIDKLQLLVHSGLESPAWWERIREDFLQFASYLKNHEHHETRLVQEAFNQDMGGGD